MSLKLLVLCFIINIVITVPFGYQSFSKFSDIKSKSSVQHASALHMGLAPFKEPFKEPYKKLGKGLNSAFRPVWTLLTKNPISIIITNTYSFFWALPRRNLQYDTPWTIFKNSSSEFIQWYQWPHNLPPFVYMGDHPADFFCYGLPGATLPLGNYDPCGFQLVSKKVVLKYRESELKHGRLAMLASVGFIMQEATHPLYPSIGGMSVTHMKQLSAQPLSDSLVIRAITAVGEGVAAFIDGDESTSFPFPSLPSLPSLPSIPSLPLPSVTSLPPLTSQASGLFHSSPLPGGIELPDVLNGDFGGITGMSPILSTHFPLDYLLVVAFLANFELRALYRNWGRWERAEYNHQFDHNIGVGNLKEAYENGDYGFDPLELMPTDRWEKLDMQNKELNNGRIAMVAIIGMIVQEYMTGTAVISSAMDLLPHGVSYADVITGSDGRGLAFDDIGSVVDYVKHLPDDIKTFFKAKLPAI